MKVHEKAEVILGEVKGAQWDSTKLAALFVSLASLVVSGSSMYQSYLNRLYTEDTNRPMLTVTHSKALFLPEKGWLLENATVQNVGKMTALQVSEQGTRARANGDFSDECFVMASKMERNGTSISILPGASAMWQYIIAIKAGPECLDKFRSADLLPTVQVVSTFKYTDRAQTAGMQDLSVEANSPLYVGIRPQKK